MKRNITPFNTLFLLASFLILGTLSIDQAYAQGMTQGDPPLRTNRSAAQALTQLAQTNDKSDVADGQLEGRYAISLQGILPAPTPVSAAGLGIFTLDGGGNISGSETASIGGQIFKRTVVGSYARETDGNISLELNFTTGTQGRLNLRGVVLNQGAEIQLIGTDPGTVINGVAKRL